MASSRVKQVVHLGALVLAMAVSAVKAIPPGSDKPDLEQKVSEMLSKLTLEEKIDLIGGDKSFYVRAEPKIGLPELRMADGPMGVRNAAPTSTAYPADIALAATFDPQLANRMGVAMGRDSRARGVHFLLGPAVDMYRVPMCGRNAEIHGRRPSPHRHHGRPDHPRRPIPRCRRHHQALRRQRAGRSSHDRQQ